MGNPENLEAPSKPEKYPPKDPTKTLRDLGRTAIQGANKKR